VPFAKRCADCLFTTLSIDDYRNKVLEESDPNEAVFAIIFSGVGSREHGSVKEFLSIGKLQAVLTDVLFVLFFVHSYFTGEVYL
jgi:hypothetical protein